MAEPSALEVASLHLGMACEFIRQGRAQPIPCLEDVCQQCRGSGTIPVTISSTDDAAAIAEALTGTDDVERRARVAARYIAGATYKAIGQDEGISGARVSQIIYKVRRMLVHPRRIDDVARHFAADHPIWRRVMLIPRPEPKGRTLRTIPCPTCATRVKEERDRELIAAGKIRACPECQQPSRKFVRGYCVRCYTEHYVAGDLEGTLPWEKRRRKEQPHVAPSPPVLPSSTMCPRCGLTLGHVTTTVHLGGLGASIANVPALRCPKCHGDFFAPSTQSRLQEFIASLIAKARQTE